MQQFGGLEGFAHVRSKIQAKESKASVVCAVLLQHQLHDTSSLPPDAHSRNPLKDLLTLSTSHSPLEVVPGHAR